MEYKLYKYGDFSVYLAQITNNPALSKREREKQTAQDLITEIFGNDTIIEHDEHGKPYIKNSNCHISISHSKHWLCIAMSSDANLGVDIEEYDDRLIRVKQKFLDSEQLALIPHNDLRCLALCWSQKEAAYKLVGNIAGALGEYVELDVASVARSNDRINKIFCAKVQDVTLKMTVVEETSEYEIVVCQYMNK